jgi:nucleoside-diphosphate-sugar epimerase
MRSTSGLMLLTGASGFIGAAFLRQVLSQGFRVRVLTRRPNDWPSQAGLEVFEGDLANTKDWDEAVQGVQVVIHAAAEIKDPGLMPMVNVQGPSRLFDAAIKAGVKRWVQLSSVGAYGPLHAGVVTEEYVDRPVGPYEASKTDFDELLKHAANIHGIEVCIVRPSNVYGPGMRNQSIGQMINAIRKGLFAFIGPSGASANYVHVNDVVQALALCVEQPQAAHQTYIVSAWATMEDMVSGLAAGTGIAPPKRRICLPMAKCLAVLFQWTPRWPLTMSRVQALSTRSRYSTEKIERELGWRLSVPVKEGMRQFAKDIHP